MIPGIAPTNQAAADGDIITPAVLTTVLRATAPTGTLHLPPPDPHSTDTVPVLIARPTRADADVRAHARNWVVNRAGRYDAADPAEEALLHGVETSALVRPPVPERAVRLDAELVEIYLWLAHHWIGMTRAAADSRYLNAALKLLAACLLAPPEPTGLHAHVLSQAVETLTALPLPKPARPPAQPPSPMPPASREPRTGRIALMAGAHSKGLPQFLAAAAACGIPLAGIVLHEKGPGTTPPSSAYASAWYPPPHAPAPLSAWPTAQAPGVPQAHVAHRDWPAAATALTTWDCDLLVLLGMEVVPASLLAAPRTATINAHNGALPTYRGMDAVAWALLAGDDPMCSVHLVTETVDAGDVLSQAAVPAGSPNLRAAVKAAQISLLTDVCRHFHTTGALPPGRHQTGTARTFYRMHPALRRVLDQRHPPAPAPPTSKGDPS